MEDFAESVRNDSGAALPKDGTVAESTSNVLVFLEHLAECADTAGAVLVRSTGTDPSYGNALASLPQKGEDNHRILLGVYISQYRVVTQLIAFSDYTFTRINFNVFIYVMPYLGFIII